MLKSIRRTAQWMALAAVVGLIVPAAAMGDGHGSGRGAGRGGSQGNHRGPVASQKNRGSAGAGARAGQGRVRVNSRRPPNAATRRRGQGGSLSYNAYWRAATSPIRPTPKQSYNAYWQKVQAQQEYQKRQQK
jgi:hypothetical protein